MISILSSLPDEDPILDHLVSSVTFTGSIFPDDWLRMGRLAGQAPTLRVNWIFW